MQIVDIKIQIVVKSFFTLYFLSSPFLLKNILTLIIQNTNE
jgi:hypothetical protein